jgi:hypothetical protein
LNMALDFGLLNTNAPAQIAGAYGRGQQEAQANQLAQLQMRQQTASTQGAEMNLTRLQQEHDALDKLMTEITANGGPSDPMQAADMMMKSKIPEYFKRGLEMKQSYAQLNNDRVAMGLPPLSSAAAPAPAVSSNRVNEPNAAPGVEVFKVPEQPAPVNALAAQTQTQAPDKNALMTQAKAKLLSPNVGVREAGKLEMQQLLSPPVMHTVAPGASLVGPDGKPLFTAAERTDTDLIRNFNAAKAQGFTGNIFDYERKINESRRTPAPAPTPSAPVAVVDPVTGKQVYVSREDALRGRMTPAAAMESLNPKEIQKREAAYPQATSTIKGIEDKASSFTKDLTELLNHPGLSSITGIAAGRLPGITAEGRAAQAIYDKIVAKGGFQALQEMRDASKTGGALGAVSNQEGTQLKASFAAIDRRQEAKDVKDAIKQAIDDVERTKVRMREAYDSTYSYKSGGGGAAAAPAVDVRSQADAILKGGK